jgi:rfaE bifunctional protein nucleotidyltransferase chain/domain
VDEAAAFAERVRAAGGKVVLTGGGFDLLHAGHIRHLRHARALGDALIVVIASDAAVRAGKGPDRPINPQHERAEVVLALEPVDVAVMAGHDGTDDLVTRIRPDILVTVAGAVEEPTDSHIVGQWGGRIVRIARAPGFSTTALVRQIRGLR